MPIGGGGWSASEGEPISEECKWTINDLEYAEAINPTTVDLDANSIEHGAPGMFIYQSTNAWGIAPNDIGLIGCNYVYEAASYNNFMIQFDVVNEDNDGVGIVFGWKSNVDHFVAHNINDDWPKEGNALLDGFPGPNMKIKRRFQSCVTHQTSADPCFETLASLNAARGGHANKLSPEAIPSQSYAPNYVPYAMNTCDGVTKPTRYYLIVKDGTARYMRQVEGTGQTVAVWTDKLGSRYQGGKIGLFTYADQLFWYNLKVWNLDTADLSKGYCNGRGVCGDDGLCRCKKGWSGVACQTSSSGITAGTASKSKSSDDDDMGDSSSAVTALVACSFVMNLFMVLAVVLLVYRRSLPFGGKMPYFEMNQGGAQADSYRSPLAASAGPGPGEVSGMA
mmetsp:Transcript_16832/g.67917  ORF Transcript_16832/g.67917 Transcript_16832/m.67917 type:complete len:393 (-) Transcript_16832:1993-3171(-)